MLNGTAPAIASTSPLCHLTLLLLERTDQARLDRCCYLNASVEGRRGGILLYMVFGVSVAIYHLSRSVILCDGRIGQRTIERSTGYAVKVKRHHGTRCQACGFDFASKYGVQLGEGFIEAHHLRPLSSLEEGEVATYTVATDFAVLCSNCHRMIHRMILRMDGPWDVASLQGHIRHS